MVGEFPSLPSLSPSVYPASIESLHPSLSESRSNISTVVSLSVSVGVRDSIESCAPLLLLSTNPVSLTSIFPSLFVSNSPLPDSITSYIPSLSESRSIPLPFESPSTSQLSETFGVRPMLSSNIATFDPLA